MSRIVEEGSVVWLDLDVEDEQENDEFEVKEVNHKRGEVVEEVQANLFIVKLDEVKDENGDPFHIGVSLDEVVTYDPNEEL